jgi:hypothetical protein
VSNVGVTSSKNNFEFLCCAICDEVPETDDLIEDVKSEYEAPDDIVIEELVMQAVDNKQQCWLIPIFLLETLELRWI